MPKSRLRRGTWNRKKPGIHRHPANECGICAKPREARMRDPDEDWRNAIDMIEEQKKARGEDG